MADYATTRDGGVFHRPSNAFIPDDDGNRDWRDYQAWLAAGNTADLLESDEHFLVRAQHFGRARIRAEMARRCALQVEALDDPAQVDLLAEIWPHRAASKSSDADLQYVRSVVLAARQLLGALRSESDPAVILNFNVRAWNGWPAEP
jgi:hypothetical protein